MQTLNDPQVTAVSGAGKPDLIDPYLFDHFRPVPIWHPTFPLEL